MAKKIHDTKQNISDSPRTDVLGETITPDNRNVFCVHLEGQVYGCIIRRPIYGEYVLRNKEWRHADRLANHYWELVDWEEDSLKYELPHVVRIREL